MCYLYTICTYSLKNYDSQLMLQIYRKSPINTLNLEYVAHLMKKTSSIYRSSKILQQENDRYNYAKI